MTSKFNLTLDVFSTTRNDGTPVPQIKADMWITNEIPRSSRAKYTLRKQTFVVNDRSGIVGRAVQFVSNFNNNVPADATKVSIKLGELEKMIDTLLDESLPTLFEQLIPVITFRYSHCDDAEWWVANELVGASTISRMLERLSNIYKQWGMFFDPTDFVAEMKRVRDEAMVPSTTH